MSSYSVRDRHEFHCDSCPAQKVVIAETLAEALGVAKQDGWTCFRHEEHFHHECPRCSD